MFKPKYSLIGFLTVLLLLLYAAGAMAEEQKKTISAEKGYCTVQKGDTLYGIACQNNISVKDLMRANNLTGITIFPEQILIIPEKKFIYTSRGDIPRDDLILLAKIIHAEARGESLNGKIAVGAVIINRLSSPSFPKTVREVIWQSNNGIYQFSPVADGSINLEPDEHAIFAAEMAFTGQDPTNGALYFYNPYIARDRWIRTLPVLNQIGNHVFATKV